MATKKKKKQQIKRKLPVQSRHSLKWEAQKFQYDRLREHIGHEIECVCYCGGNSSDPENVSVECNTCGTVIVDANHPDRC